MNRQNVTSQRATSRAAAASVRATTTPATVTRTPTQQNTERGGIFSDGWWDGADNGPNKWTDANNPDDINSPINPNSGPPEEDEKPEQTRGIFDWEQPPGDEPGTLADVMDGTAQQDAEQEENQKIL